MPPRTDYHRFQKFKVLAHAEKIEDIVTNRMPAPVEWIIYPSNICGYRCPHCIMAEEQALHHKLLSPGAMLKIPVDAKRLGIQTVVFSGGGDPLINKLTVPTAYQLKLSGIRTGINNQGYLLNDPTAFDFIRYSIDAANKQTYEAIHRFDGWDRVVHNIQRHQLLREAGEQIEMGLAFLITPSNYTETSDFCEWGQQFNPDFIHIRPAFLDSPYLDSQYPGGGQALKEEIIPSLGEVGKRMESLFPNVYYRVDKFEGYWTPKLYDKCRATPLMAVTSGDGAFLICQDRGIKAGEESYRWGDYNAQTFDQIWWSQEHRDAINQIDLSSCPRCVENGYNEIIQMGFIDDQMKMALL